MTVDGKEGGAITLAQAAEMTQRYRHANLNPIKARLFGKDCINELLNQGAAGTVQGIRMYFALNDTGEQELVLVGVDANGQDMLGLIMDLSAPCPKHCSGINALNSK